MVRQLRCEVMDRVCLASSWRTIEEKPLAPGEPQGFNPIPSRDELPHVAVEDLQRACRQHHIVSPHGGQRMHFDRATAACWILRVLE